ncbi:MAG: GGDEF domain-containing protein [Vulcanimicrobiota bacterium]
MSEGLREFYAQVVSNPELNRQLKFDPMWGCLLNVLAGLLAIMATGGVLELLDGQTSGQPSASLLLWFPLAAWFAWKRRPYSGPIYLYFGEVVSQTILSTSAAELPACVVRWSEQYELDRCGRCRPMGVKNATYTRLDMSCPVGGRLRLVMAHGNEICPLPAYLVVPGSTFQPGPDYPQTQLDRRKRTFFDSAERQFQQGRMFAILIDIDHLGRLDKDQGDEAVAAVLKNLRTTLGSGGNLGHFGGDEFYVTAPGSLEQGLVLAERLRARVASKTTVTVSLGLAARGDSLAEVLSQADQALRQAKSEGRDRVISAV